MGVLHRLWRIALVVILSVVGAAVVAVPATASESNGQLTNVRIINSNWMDVDGPCNAKDIQTVVSGQVFFACLKWEIPADATGTVSATVKVPKGLTYYPAAPHWTEAVTLSGEKGANEFTVSVDTDAMKDETWFGPEDFTYGQVSFTVEDKVAKDTEKKYTFDDGVGSLNLLVQPVPEKATCAFPVAPPAAAAAFGEAFGRLSHVLAVSDDEGDDDGDELDDGNYRRTQCTFTLSKALIGDGAGLIDPDRSYTVKFTVTDPQGKKSDEGSFKIEAKAGGGFSSKRYPAGSTVHFDEVKPDDSDGLTWADPVFSANDVRIGCENPEDDSIDQWESHWGWGNEDDDDGHGGDPGHGGGGHGGDQVCAASVGASVVVTNSVSRRLGSVSWAKVDGAGKALSGSEWSLTPEHGDVVTVVDNGAHDADKAPGSLRVEGLSWGSYVLKETKAPAGYVKTGEVKKVTVDGSHLEVGVGSIVNEPVGSTPVPSSSSPVPSASPSSVHPSVSPSGPGNPGGRLPFTGAAVAGVGVIAVLVILAGVAIVLASRRRRLK